MSSLLPTFKVVTTAAQIEMAGQSPQNQDIHVIRTDSCNWFDKQAKVKRKRGKSLILLSTR